MEEIKRRRAEGNWNVAEKTFKRDTDLQRQEQLEESRYNAEYREIGTLPKYLYKEEEKRKQNIAARFRCGSEE